MNADELCGNAVLSMSSTQTDVQKTPLKLLNGHGMSNEHAKARILEKLDAGLRSLDHCELSSLRIPSMPDFRLRRQEQAAIMALQPPPESDTSGALGNALSRNDAKMDAVACP